MNTELQPVIEGIGRHLLGKQTEIKLALACLLAKGHLLIEDLPGMGKTTLAEAMARILGLNMQRIQFTSDLLPADILGVSIYDRKDQSFNFLPGPIFSQVILADEINRATPKTQSALLEAMEEGQVTTDGRTRPLPRPFFVIATQNPMHQIGTYPLPESQLDRFLMRLRLGYPDSRTERELLRIEDTREALRESTALLQPERLLELQQSVMEVHVSDALLDYVQALLLASRRSDNFSTGLSPRAGRSLLRGAQAWAYLDDRDIVLPEHVQAVLPSITNHRLRSSYDATHESAEEPALILLRTPLPHP
ncbi:MoxR-like ATPase [Desulfonatronum thiosulfatophilum]|uniref:MoxR-like ATPase n=1 Tax=Desulfonatronum thiosulfatophilum TaxID=617002 RepID=A0A1G6DCE9_9BACT|nr:AAA family ATPase [Desulfonatronum thiosulfatophilum]SDB42801.1 MoxR-like ATPase [Desulfonatronum thiosulfatophilum]